MRAAGELGGILGGPMGRAWESAWDRADADTRKALGSIGGRIVLSLLSLASGYLGSLLSERPGFSVGVGLVFAFAPLATLLGINRARAPGRQRDEARAELDTYDESDEARARKAAQALTVALDGAQVTAYALLGTMRRHLLGFFTPGDLQARLGRQGRQASLSELSVFCKEMALAGVFDEAMVDPPPSAYPGVVTILRQRRIEYSLGLLGRRLIAEMTPSARPAPGTSGTSLPPA